MWTWSDGEIPISDNVYRNFFGCMFMNSCTNQFPSHRTQSWNCGLACRAAWAWNQNRTRWYSCSLPDSRSGRLCGYTHWIIGCQVDQWGLHGQSTTVHLSKGWSAQFCIFSRILDFLTQILFKTIAKKVKENGKYCRLHHTAQDLSGRHTACRRRCNEYACILEIHYFTDLSSRLSGRFPRLWVSAVCRCEEIGGTGGIAI